MEGVTSDLSKGWKGLLQKESRKCGHCQRWVHEYWLYPFRLIQGLALRQNDFQASLRGNVSPFFLFWGRGERQVFSIQDQYRPISLLVGGIDRYERSERGGPPLSFFLQISHLEKGMEREDYFWWFVSTFVPGGPSLYKIVLLFFFSFWRGEEEVLTDGDNLKADVILEDVTGDDRYWSEQLYCYECHEQGC